MTKSKYEELVNALTDGGVKLRDAAGEYRSTYDIIADLAARWTNLTSMQQSAITTALAGTRQTNVFNSLIQNFQKEAMGAMETMADEPGALIESYSKYTETIEAHVNMLKAAFSSLGQDMVDTDLAKNVVDIGTKMVGMLDTLVKMRVPLQVIAGIVATIAASRLFPFLGTKLFIDLPKKLKAIAAAIKSIGTAAATAESTVTALSAVLTTIVLVGSAIGTAASIANKIQNDKWDAIEESAAKTAESVSSINEKYSQVIGKMQEYARIYKETNGKYDSEAIAEISSIQSEIKGILGEQAEGIDLINGKYADQIEKLYKILELNDQIEGKSPRSSKMAIEEAEAAAETAFDKLIKRSTTEFSDLTKILFEGIDSDTYVLGKGRNLFGQNTDKGASIVEAVLKKAGVSVAKGELSSWGIKNKDVWTIEEISDLYGKIGRVLEALNNVSDEGTAEILARSESKANLEKFYGELSNIVDTYGESRDNAWDYDFYRALRGLSQPTEKSSKEEIEKFKKDFAKNLDINFNEATGRFTGGSKDYLAAVEKFVKNLISDANKLDGFGNKVEETLEIDFDTEKLEKLETVFSSINGVFESMAKGEGAKLSDMKEIKAAIESISSIDPETGSRLFDQIINSGDPGTAKAALKEMLEIYLEQAAALNKLNETELNYVKQMAKANHIDISIESYTRAVAIQSEQQERLETAQKLIDKATVHSAEEMEALSKASDKASEAVEDAKKSGKSSGEIAVLVDKAVKAYKDFYYAQLEQRGIVAKSDPAYQTLIDDIVKATGASKEAAEGMIDLANAIRNVQNHAAKGVQISGLRNIAQAVSTATSIRNGLGLLLQMSEEEINNIEGNVVEDIKTAAEDVEEYEEKKAIKIDRLYDAKANVLRVDRQIAIAEAELDNTHTLEEQVRLNEKLISLYQQRAEALKYQEEYSRAQIDVVRDEILALAGKGSSQEYVSWIAAHLQYDPRTFSAEVANVVRDSINKSSVSYDTQQNDKWRSAIANLVDEYEALAKSNQDTILEMEQLGSKISGLRDTIYQAQKEAAKTRLDYAKNSNLSRDEYSQEIEKYSNLSRKSGFQAVLNYAISYIEQKMKYWMGGSGFSEAAINSLAQYMIVEMFGGLDSKAPESVTAVDLYRAVEDFRKKYENNLIGWSKDMANQLNGMISWDKLAAMFMDISDLFDDTQYLSYVNDLASVMNEVRDARQEFIQSEIDQMNRLRDYYHAYEYAILGMNEFAKDLSDDRSLWSDDEKEKYTSLRETAASAMGDNLSKIFSEFEDAFELAETYSRAVRLATEDLTEQQRQAIQLETGGWVSDDHNLVVRGNELLDEIKYLREQMSAYGLEETLKNNGLTELDKLKNYRTIISEIRQALMHLYEDGFTQTDEVVQNALKSQTDYINKIYESLKDLTSDYKDRLSEITSVYKTLTDAVSSYNDKGVMTVDVFEQLMSMEPKYLQYLLDENGRISFNKDAIEKLTATRVQDLKVAKAYQLLEMTKTYAEEANGIEKINELLSDTLETGRTEDQNFFVEQIDELVKAGKLTAQIGTTLKTAIKNIFDWEVAISDYAESAKSGVELVEGYLEDMISKAQSAADELLDKYQKMVDKRKEQLELVKSEYDYQNKIADSVNEVSDIQTKLDLLALDNSREARAQEVELRKSLVSAQRNLSETQYDNAVDKITDALDKAVKNFSELVDDMKKALTERYDSPDELRNAAIKALTEGTLVLDSAWTDMLTTGLDGVVTQLTPLLEKYIVNKSSGENLLNDIVAWNTEEGSSLTKDLIGNNGVITMFWEGFSKSGKTLEQYLQQIVGNQEELNTASGLKNNTNVGNSAGLRMVGDMNGDGYITADDARLILRASSNLEKLSDVDKAFADANFDGKITAEDARAVLRASAMLPNESEYEAVGDWLTYGDILKKIGVSVSTIAENTTRTVDLPSVLAEEAGNVASNKTSVDNLAASMNKYIDLASATGDFSPNVEVTINESSLAEMSDAQKTELAGQIAVRITKDLVSNLSRAIGTTRNRV